MSKSLRAVIGITIVIGGAVAFVMLNGNPSDEQNPTGIPSMASGENPLAAYLTADNTKVPPVQTDGRPVPSATGPWPKAVTEETVYGFGRMEVMQTGEYSFPIRNEGDSILMLQTGQSTCQCTLFKVEKDKLAPGEETRVVINWQPKSRDPAFRHGGPVYTNDPKNPKLDFAIEGAVDVAIELLPSSIWDAGNIYRDRPGTFNAAIASKIYDQFQIKSISATSEFVSFEVLPMEAADKVSDNWSSGYQIIVNVSPDIPSGLFTAEARITVDCSEETISIPVRARKYGAVKFIPTAGVSFDPDEMLLKLGNFASSAGRTVDLTVLVENEGMTEPLKITNKESTPSFLTAEIVPVGPPSGKTQRCNLTISVPPGRPRMQHTASNPANLKLTTNHPLGETISINVLFSTN